MESLPVLRKWKEWCESDRVAKRVYVGACAGSRSVGKPRKRSIDTMKDYLRKRGLDVWQDSSEWQGFLRGNLWAVTRGMNPKP